MCRSPTFRPIVRLFSWSAALLLAVSGCSSPKPRADDSPGSPSAEGDGASPVQVHVLGWNDFHGHLESPAGRVEVDGEEIEAGGAAPLAHHVRSHRDEHEHTATLVAGDLIGASPLISALFHDEPTVEVMNALGLDGVAVGNHEFDEGWNELVRIAEGGCHPEDGCREDSSYEGAEFPYLAANVYRPDGERLFDPYVIREYDGVRIAYVGMVLDGIPSIVMPSAVEGLTFENEVESLEQIVPELRERGVETIVVAIHEGGYPKNEGSAALSGCPGLEGPIVDIVESSPDAVDAFLTGHTHKTYVCRVDGRLVTSAMSKGRLVTEMQLEIDRNSGDVVEASAENAIVRADGPRAEDIAKLVESYGQLAAEKSREPVGRLEEAVSRQADESGESPLGALIADAQLAATESENAGGADFALMNPGGVRASLEYESSGDREAGVVTYGDLHEVQPFRNQLVVMTLTGEQIHAILENQWGEGDHATILQASDGLAYSWHPDREVGDRVDPEDVRIDGEKLDLQAEYRVTVNDFLSEGGDGFKTLKQGTNRTFGPIDIDALKSYFGRNSPVSPPSEARIRRSPD